MVPRIELQVEVCRRDVSDGISTLGLSFAAAQERTVGALAVAVAHGEVARPESPGRTGGGMVWEGTAT